MSLPSHLHGLDALASLLAETTWGILIRSRERSWEGEHWRRIPSLTTTQAPLWIGEWARVLNDLTRALLSLNTVTATPSASAKKPDAFNGWLELAWTREHLQELWLLTLRALGHPLNHGWEAGQRETVVRTLVETAEQLLEPNVGLAVQELGPVLLDLASGLTDAAEVRARCLAIAMVGRLFVRRWPEAIIASEAMEADPTSGKGLWLRFLGCLRACLEGESEPAMLTALAHAADPIGLGLPGSPLLIPSQLQAIGRLIGMTEAWSVVLPPALRTLQTLLIMPDLVAPQIKVGETLSLGQVKQAAWELLKQLDPLYMEAGSQAGYLACLSTYVAHELQRAGEEGGEEASSLLLSLLPRLTELSENGQHLLLDALHSLFAILPTEKQLRLMNSIIESLSARSEGGQLGRLVHLAVAGALCLPPDWIQSPQGGGSLWTSLLALREDGLREWALEHLLAVQNAWPLHGQASAASQGKGLLFALGDQILLQVQSHGGECRLAVRSGILPHLAWSVSLPAAPAHALSAARPKLSMPEQTVVSPWIDATPVEYQREERQLPPRGLSETVLERIDVLAEALAYLSEDHYETEDHEDGECQ